MSGKTNTSAVRQVALTVSVTPSNSVDLPRGDTRAVYVGGTGDLAVTYPSGTEDTITSLTPGLFHPLVVRRIRATGTTATGIKACY